MNIFARLSSRYSLISRLFLFVASIVLIVLQFPQEAKFKYEFQKGKPWMHDDLIAPFDFAILKTDVEVAAEKANAIENSKPFFTRNESVAKDKKEQFRVELNEKWQAKYGSKNARQYKAIFKIANNILDSIYSKGVIQKPQQFEDKQSDFIITVMNGNVAEEQELGKFLTVATAGDYIKSSLLASKNMDVQLVQPVLLNALSQNIFFDEELTSKFEQNLAEQTSVTHGMVQKGERIIAKGELVSTPKFQVLESLKKEYESQLGSSSKYYSILLGQLLLVSIAILVLVLFFYAFRRDVLAENKKIFFILLLIFIMVSLTSAVVKIDVTYLYLVPLCMLPVIIRAFFDTRIALFVHIVTVIIIGFIAPDSFEYVFLQLIAGIIATISVVNLRKRSQFFITSVLVFLAYVSTHTGLILIQEGTLENMDTRNLIWFGGSSLLILLTYPLIYVFEKLFGLISDVSLMELSDINSKLLRQLSSKAPATLQHSMQVANLAEEAIYRIGGNPLLARVGALYHDIGKMDMPLYFIENQTTELNPHDELTSEESAAVIISHVIKGVEMAKKYILPERVTDFIRTHHGTRRSQYFLNKFVSNNPDVFVDISKFTYKGPLPFSKETAVVMMADGVEACSRTLKNPSEKSISDMVENIIDIQVQQKQFENSDITFKDIMAIKKIFKKRLQNMFHVRIEYPA